jgi:phosphoribosylaminoimidazole-succinocarboxamide synthase
LQVQALQNAARSLGVTLQIQDVHTPDSSRYWLLASYERSRYDTPTPRGVTFA